MLEQLLNAKQENDRIIQNMGIKVDKCIFLTEKISPLVESNKVRVAKLENLENSMEDTIKELREKIETLFNSKTDLVKHIEESNKVWLELHETRTIAETFKNHFSRVENYIEKY